MTIIELKKAFKILLSKEFWQDFKYYWSSKQIAKRIENFANKIKKGDAK